MHDRDDTDIVEISYVAPSDPCVVVLTGRAIGRVFPIRGELVIGRSAEADIVLDDDGVSRTHAALTTDGDQVFIADLGSTNGTFIGRERVGVEPRPLSEGERLKIGLATLLQYGRKDAVEQRFLSELYHNATRDALTGWHNRRWLLEGLDQEIAWHRRHARPLTLMMLDIDHFKQINDTHGHPAGDAVLTTICARLRAACRAEDICARYGGDELVVTLRDTSAAAGHAVAERLRRAVHDSPIAWCGRQLAVSVSVGVVTRAGDALTARDILIGDADAYLYLAKESGRNRTVPTISD